MFKKTKKMFSVLVVMAMVLTMFAGIASAAPVVTTAGIVPNILIGGDGNAAGIRIVEEYAGQFGVGDTITVKLPTGVTVNTAVVAATNVAVVGAPGYAAAGDVTVAALAVGDTELVATVGTASVGGTGTIVIPAAILDIDLDSTLAAGDIEASVIAPGVLNTKVTIAKAVTGSNAISSPDAQLVKLVRGLSGNAGKLRIQENVPGVLNVGGSIVLTAPTGTAFTAAPAVAIADVYGNAPAGLATLGAGVLSDGNRKATYNVTGASTTTTRIDFTANLAVDEDASLGAAGITVSGTATGLLGGSVSVAQLVDAGTSAATTTTPIPEVTIGVANQFVANFKIVENVAGALIGNGRKVTLTLPEGAKFTAAPGAGLSPGGGLTISGVALSADEKEATITFGGSFSTAPQTINVSMNNVTFDNTAVPGDVLVTIDGNAGATVESVVIAKANYRATIAASSKANLERGTQNNSAGNLVIKETKAGSVLSGAGNALTVATQTGLSFTEIPTVAVTASNMKLGAATLNAAGDVLTIPVTAISTSGPAEITISNIKYDVYNHATLGDQAVTLDGINALSAKNASVGTGGRVLTSSVFTIGSTSYVVDGVSMTMDVAPVIKNGRTLLPLRFAAASVGVSEDNIIWDGSRRTVTLIRGDRVVQVQIGSTTMLINGVAITIDVAPEIIDGRTVLPIRAISTALNASIAWDEAAKTVTIKAQ